MPLSVSACLCVKRGGVSVSDCPTGCSTCTGTGTGQCSQCSTGYTSVNGVCQPTSNCARLLFVRVVILIRPYLCVCFAVTCPSNCATCSSSTVCTSCKQGYTLSSTGSCNPTSTRCCLLSTGFLSLFFWRLSLVIMCCSHLPNWLLAMHIHYIMHRLQQRYWRHNSFPVSFWFV